MAQIIISKTITLQSFIILILYINYHHQYNNSTNKYKKCHQPKLQVFIKFHTTFILNLTSNIPIDEYALTIRTITEIVNNVIASYDKGETINLTKLKTKISAKNKLKKMPKIVDILAAIPDRHKDKLNPILKGKPVRTASGIAVVAVMSKPHRCPHIAMTGNICVYCPGGPDSDFEYSTQSYTGYEPTSMRAIRARYNPYL